VIVDCHCHAGKGDGLSQPADTAAPLGRVLARARAAGIDRTIIFAAFADDYRRANREVAAMIARRPDRLSGFAFLHAARDKGRIETMIREAVLDLGLVGIKLHRHDAPITREVCEAARRYRLPILYDVMGEVSVAEILAQEYPDVAFIIPHLGSFADDWRAQIALIDHLVRHKNIFTDTAGVRRFDVLEQAVKRAGACKILFGTDGPWLHPAVELAKIEALSLKPEERAAILGGNIMRLVGRAQELSSA
jgi:predicted TIM-barrel fold metal-dependent hydrolase